MDEQPYDKGIKLSPQTWCLLKGHNTKYMHHLGNSLKKKKKDPKSEQGSPSDSQSTQSMTEELVKCHYKEASRHMQNV